jgi:hypothetical protein
MKFSTDAPHTATGSADFKVYTSAMEIDTDGENVVRMVGSSTIRDLQGDTMDIGALTDMTRVEPGQTTWLNHRYDLPHDLFGSLLASPTLTAESGIADIHIVSDVEMSNPEAAQTLKLVKNGRRLGCSIGCMVLEFAIDEENDDGSSWWPPIIILHVQVLEFSVVGVPANQRCWVEPAAKGLFERVLTEGKGDIALKLAPAVKGLYPRAYMEMVKGTQSEGLRRDLERIDVRPVQGQRVEWSPNEKTFMINRKGVYTPVSRAEATAFLANVRESRPFGQKESTPGIAPCMTNTGLAPDIEKGASGKTDWPLADRDRAWDNGEAHKHIQDWAGGDDPDWGKVKTVHFWFDDEESDKWGGYKLLFCDNDNGIKAVPRAIFACAAAIQGARGGLKIPEEDVPAVKKKIESYYKRMSDEFNDPDIVVPWADDGKGMKPSKQMGTPVVTPCVNATTTNATQAEVLVTQWTEEVGTQKTEEKVCAEQVFVMPNGTRIVTPIDHRNAVLSDQGNMQVPITSSQLDVHLYNMLAAQFGMPPLTTDALGNVIRPRLGASAEEMQDLLTCALNLIKSGTEFSKENRAALQDLHDGLVQMCMSSFHPCKEMKADSDGDGDENDPDHDGDAAYDNDGDGDGAVNYIPAKSLQEFMMTTFPTAQVEQLSGKMDALLLAFKDVPEVRTLKARADDLARQFKALQTEARRNEQDLARVRHMPLGQPTRINRQLYQDPAAVSYEELASLTTRGLSQNENERRWSLEEALKATMIIQKSVNGKQTNYRRWPEGIGGDVTHGVRPPLTGDQRAFMRPGEAVAYTDGQEACVPCYDDPGGMES